MSSPDIIFAIGVCCGVVLAMVVGVAALGVAYLIEKHNGE